ncbi:MAG: SDR family NAD(P)-dependent oxidoreductase [Phycisphaeraceae bacterium]
MTQALADKTVVIVGGTTGLGVSAARACVAAGACVVVVGRKPEAAQAAEDELGERGVAVVGDAADPQTAPRAIETALARFGRFDALYHVAGGSGRRFGDGPLHELTDEGIDTTLDLNLKSLILSNRAAVQNFLDRAVPGAVLNMGSVLGCSPSPHYFATHVYAATKSAIIGFTKSCAAYYAPRDIRFNVIAPGLVETPMAQRAAADETILAFIKTKQPLDGGRIGRPDDLDDAVVYLLSGSARYVTGQVLAVDGGWSVSEGQVVPATEGGPS